MTAATVSAMLRRMLEVDSFKKYPKLIAMTVDPSRLVTDDAAVA
jgi:hypothetical protein